jgi:deazaflavin-dependent oxidoreductase (nitroreductase family)
VHSTAQGPPFTIHPGPSFTIHPGPSFTIQLSFSTAAGEDAGMARSYHLGPARRAVNTVMTAMLRAGVGGRSAYLLTTIGRKSGQRRTTPVILVETGGQRWLVSPYGMVGWVHNVRATPEVSLRRGRTTERLRAQEVGPETAGPILRQYVRKARVTAPFFDAKPADPVETFVAEARLHPVFRLVDTAPAG